MVQKTQSKPINTNSITPLVRIFWCGALVLTAPSKVYEPLPNSTRTHIHSRYSVDDVFFWRRARIRQETQTSHHNRKTPKYGKGQGAQGLKNTATHEILTAPGRQHNTACRVHWCSLSAFLSLPVAACHLSTSSSINAQVSERRCATANGLFSDFLASRWPTCHEAQVHDVESDHLAARFLHLKREVRMRGEEQLVRLRRYEDSTQRGRCEFRDRTSCFQSPAIGQQHPYAMPHSGSLL